MKNLVLCILLLCAASAHAQNKLDQLAWLAGCWMQDGAEAGTTEQWMAPAGGTMVGMGRTVRAGKTVEFEFMRIHTAPDGKLLFTALPSGQKEATFTELRIDDTGVVFENLAHDFPHRVIYRHLDNRLLASIEGMRKGAAKTISFPMRRIACER